MLHLIVISIGVSVGKPSKKPLLDKVRFEIKAILYYFLGVSACIHDQNQPVLDHTKLYLFCVDFEASMVNLFFRS
jgi:hypothetical protein